MHIILIDDRAEHRQRMAEFIGRDHPEAQIAHVDGEGAFVRALEGAPIDLAIADTTLGWGRGLDALRRVKRIHPDCGTIVYASAESEDQSAAALKAGIDDYIVKDIASLARGGHDRLRRAIHAVLRHGRDRQRMALTMKRYEDLFQRVTVGLFACDAEGRFLDANPALLSMLGIDHLDDLAQRRFADVFVGANLPLIGHTLPVGGLSGIQVRVRRNDGQVLTALLNAYPSSDGEGQLQGVLTNVTALRKALDDKTALLREVYHRVYNNLQLVISLLGLQSRYCDDEDVRSRFREVMNRIRSLSLVQRKLYQCEPYSAVDFSAYLRDLVTSLLPPGKAEDIAIEYDMQPVLLPIDKAVPLALIANELLMNAMKHAFPDNRKGHIRVALSEGPEKRAVFSISDDGVGSSPAQMACGTGVGAKLVHQLALQADARLTVDSNGGFATTIEFERGETVAR